MDRLFPRLIAIGIVAIALPSAARAQDSSLTSGRLVRFELQGESQLQTARVDIATRDSLLVRECVDCKRTRFAFVEFQRLEVLRSGRGAFAGALLGAGAGFLGGALVGAGIGAISDSRTKCRQECIHGLGVAFGVIVFAPVGAVIGTFVGAFEGAAHWKSVLPPRVSKEFAVAERADLYAARFATSPPTELIVAEDSFSGNGKLSDGETRKLELAVAEYARSVEFRGRKFTGFDPFRAKVGDSVRIFRTDLQAKALAKAFGAPIINSDPPAVCPASTICDSDSSPSAVTLVSIGAPRINAAREKATVNVSVVSRNPGDPASKIAVTSSMHWEKHRKSWVHVTGGTYGPG